MSWQVPRARDRSRPRYERFVGSGMKRDTRDDVAKRLGVSISTVRRLEGTRRNLCELGGFDVSGAISVADIIARVGAGEYRVSAYGFEPRGLRWEVFVRLGEEAS